MANLNPEQAEALEALQTFLKSAESYFVLSGFAGTGKTFTLKALIAGSKAKFAFTAPTNKATRVLRDTLKSETYNPACKTIYSLLGLRMEANGAVKELTVPDDDDVKLDALDAVVVDEASMISKTLLDYIQRAQARSGVKFIFLGDIGQLPPVGEKMSPVWQINCRSAALFKVMRSGDAILDFVTKIREQISKPAPKIAIRENNAEGEGVWTPTLREGLDRMRLHAELSYFQTPERTKIIAWRNATVHLYNETIRRYIFGSEALRTKWLPQDRVILTAPWKNPKDDRPEASTDDEGTVTKVTICPHPIESGLTTWKLDVMLDTNVPSTLYVLHPDSEVPFFQRKAELHEAAKATPRKWRDFWRFLESFSEARHAYAITAHRAQGSTYHTAFVDWRDILSNRDRSEAFRCFYVACSRPRKELILLDS